MIARAKLVSPLTYIHPGLPPTFIINGDHDNTYNPTQSYKLKAALDSRTYYDAVSELKDIVWFTPDGAEMASQDWNRPDARTLGMLLGGDAIPSLDRFGQPIVGNTLLILVNAGPSPVEFVLPAVEWGERWEVLIDTRSAAPPDRSLPAGAGERYAMVDRSMVVMRLPKGS